MAGPAGTLTVPRPPTALDLEQARLMIARHLAPTPLLASPGLGRGVLLKLESAQPTGSFKVRGALAALGGLATDLPVVATSAGNHGLGVAWAAQLLGRQATIVVPESASPAKLEKLSRFRATTVRHGQSFREAEAYGHDLTGAGAHYLSPYNDAQVIAGQATIGAELEHLEGPLTVVAPIGGGGLIAGLACWAAGRGDVQLVGVEAASSPAMSAALGAHSRDRPCAATIADGIAGGIEPGSVTVELARARLDRLVQVTEDEIAEAIGFLATEHGVVAEGAGAVGTAALLGGQVRVVGTTIVLLSGRNISLALLAAVLDRSTNAGA